MTPDEQRKRIYELEIALGSAIKVAEQLRDLVKKSEDNFLHVQKVNTLLINGCKNYLDTMKKQDFLDTIDRAMNYVKQRP